MSHNVMFLTLKRNTLYTLLLICSLVIFVPAHGFIDSGQEGPLQEGQEQEDQNSQEQDSEDSPETTEFSEPVFESDTIDVSETTFADEEIDKSIEPSRVPSRNEYYDDEDEEETSESVISFNFLYYLLQKFKFSDSLNY